MNSRQRTPAPVNLELSAHLVRGEPIPYAEAVTAAYSPFRIGERWGPPWSTTWFHVRGHVPRKWIERRVVAIFDLGFEGAPGFTCEALAWKDGQPWRGVDPNHRRLPIEGPEFDFYLEAAANPRVAEEGVEPAESMIALRTSAEPAFVFRQAQLTVLEERSDAAVAALAIDPSHLIAAVGHAHIDTAWEWPVREAKRKCARTWSTQLALLDQYPDYVFAASQPAQYEWIKHSYPDLWDRLKAHVASGRWEPVGAMWVEPDCNLPSGEALVRQLLLGKRFFLEEFGFESKIGWLPDVFGYPGNLPQLLKGAGCDYFLTQKLSWNDTNPPEHHTFWWEGIDGTRVFAHFPPADTYNGDFSDVQLEYSVRNFKDAAHSNRSLYLFGWGDGGGGPEPEMIDAAHGFGIELGRADGFFERAAAEARDLAVVAGELYFELHRGTYTSQARTKLLNRLAQQALREAEMWSVAAGAYPAEELHAAWKSLLLNQFHDILPGSSIDWVYEEANQELITVARTGFDLAARAISTIAGAGDHLVVFNSTSHARREVVDVGKTCLIVEAPACGWAVQRREQAMRLDQVAVASERGLENDLLRVEWDERGLLTSVWDKQSRREVVQGRGNVLELHPDDPARYDAWELDLEHRDTFVELTDLLEVKVLEPGGLRGTVRFVRRFGGSRLVQHMSLDAGSRLLRFSTEVEWHEDHKLLKVAFPVTVRSRDATYEIQFGHVRRPTHMDTPRARAMFEVPAQRWADLGDGGYGVALINDCKHGYDIHGATMRLSLLRAPTHPDPTADRGWHRFAYALLPHPGDFREAGVIEAAEDFNAPLRVFGSSLGDSSARSLVEVDTRQVIVEAIKRAEDSGATVVRLYEAWGRPCHARLETTLPHDRVTVCDLLERERAEASLELDFRPFQVITLKLEGQAGVGPARPLTQA